MYPSGTIKDKIFRGTHWDGKALTCYADSTNTTPSTLTGCTATVVIENTKTEHTVTIGCSIASNVITVGPLTMAQTALMDQGTYTGDLSITWPGAIVRSIYALFEFTVSDAKSS